MKISILIEATSEQCYRARGGEPFAGSVEAETPEAALEKIKKLIDDRVAQGARIVVLDLPDVVNSWLEGWECSVMIPSSIIGSGRLLTTVAR